MVGNGTSHRAAGNRLRAANTAAGSKLAQGKVPAQEQNKVLPLEQDKAAVAALAPGKGPALAQALAQVAAQVAVLAPVAALAPVAEPALALAAAPAPDKAAVAATEVLFDCLCLAWKTAASFQAAFA